MLVVALVLPVSPQWQWLVDLVRWAEILGCAPLLFFAVARIFQSPSRAQQALSVSAALLIITVAYGSIDRLGEPPTPRVALTGLAVASGLWGSWHFYRGDTLRGMRAPDPPPPPVGAA